MYSSTPSVDTPDPPPHTHTWRCHVHVFIKSLKVLCVQLVIHTRHVGGRLAVQGVPVYALEKWMALDLLFVGQGEWGGGGTGLSTCEGGAQSIQE